MKIAVIGLYYASNLGDAIICDCVAAWMKSAYPDAQVDVIDIENKREFPVQSSISELTRKRRKWNLWKDCWLTKHKIDDRIYYWNSIDVASRSAFYDEVGQRGYDAVIFAGGQLFMDWLSLDICEFLKRFEETATPVFFNACGVGSAVSEKIQKLLSKRLTAANIRLISSRDDVECIERRYLDGSRGRVMATFDPALWSKKTYGQEKKQSHTVGLGVMYFEQASQHKMTRFWIDVIHKLENQGKDWKMFCNGDLADYEYGCRILEKMGKNPDEYILRCASSPRELVAQIAGFESIIAFRLHSHIVATSFGIPGVAVVWDEKLRFFYRHLGHPERCRTIKDTGDTIINVLNEAVREGVDMMVVEKQKKFSKNLLLNSVGQVIGNEQR